MKRLTRAFVLLCALLFTVTNVFAQVPDKTEELVYSATVFDGYSYTGVFYPRSEETIYLLANVDNVLVPRNTLVYYWPITREFRADWSNLNEAVPGTLEFVSGNQVVAQVTLQKFVVEFPDLALPNSTVLHTGEAAEAKDREYRELMRSFMEQYDRYVVENAEYLGEYSRYLELRRAGEDATPPAAPEAPEAPTAQLSQLIEGFVVNLEEGLYEVRLRGNDDLIVEDSSKKLRVFKERREGITYNIIPASKWTRHERSETVEHVIYGHGNSVLYLQPLRALEYNDLYYEKLTKPQSTAGRRDRWRWATSVAIDDGRLEIWENNQLKQSISYKPYRVVQTPGYALGYEIMEVYDPDGSSRQPNFWAYKLQLDLDNQVYQIRWVDGNGVAQAPSERELRPLHTQRANLVYVFALIPFVVGLVVSVLRLRVTGKPGRIS
jgi:hypothetical protein